jgi:hypothetical protein
MNLTQTIEARLANFGIPNPPQALLASLEKKLQEKMEKMVARAINRRVIIQSFADSLVSPATQENSEGGGAEGVPPTAQQDDGERSKPESVAGAEAEVAEKENHEGH